MSMLRAAAAALALVVASVGVTSASSLGGARTATLGAVQCTVAREAAAQPVPTELLVHCQGREIPTTDLTLVDAPTSDGVTGGGESDVPTHADHSGIEPAAPEPPDRDGAVATSADEGTIDTPSPQAEDANGTTLEAE